MEAVTLTREELYELVWSTPMRKLAHRFGVSDVALSKKCAKHNIPTPGLGYWAKVAAGQKLKRVKLPRVAAGSTEPIVLKQAPVDDDGNTPEREQPPLVKVCNELTEPHEAVAWVKDELSRASTDGYNRLVVGPDWSARVRVRKACVSRVLLLLDAFFKALVARGHRIEAGFRGMNPTAEELLVSAFDSCVRIEVEEKLARKPHELTREERQRQERWPTTNFPKYDYFPDGEIQIRLRGTHYKYVGRKSWSDTRTQRLDDLLGYEESLAREKEREEKRLAGERDDKDPKIAAQRAAATRAADAARVGRPVKLPRVCCGRCGREVSRRKDGRPVAHECPHRHGRGCSAAGDDDESSVPHCPWCAKERAVGAPV